MVKRLVLLAAIAGGWAALDRERVARGTRALVDSPAVQSLSGTVAGLLDRLR
jgi:hypothetical protein